MGYLQTCEQYRGGSRNRAWDFLYLKRKEVEKSSRRGREYEFDVAVTTCGCFILTRNVCICFTLHRAFSYTALWREAMKGIFSKLNYLVAFV